MTQILLIDDERLVRAAMRVPLEEAGHDVFEADNGRKGIELHKESPCDLIITDVIMPEMEGFETIKLLRKDDDLLKIIAISGGGRIKGADYLKMAITLGADKILVKPFSNEELLDAVNDCLDGQS